MTVSKANSSFDERKIIFFSTNIIQSLTEVSVDYIIYHGKRYQDI